MMHYTFPLCAILSIVDQGCSTIATQRQLEYVNHQEEQRHIYAVCEGINTTSLEHKELDYGLPCNAITAIEYQCRYGPDLGRAILAYYHDDNTTAIVNLINSTGTLPSSSLYPDDDMPVSVSDLPEQSSETQRICFCESQWFDQSNACNACSRVHGAVSDPPVGNGIADAAMSSFSSDYCAVTHTATAPFTSYSFSLKVAAAPYGSTSLRGVTVPYSITAGWTTSEASLTYSDPLGSYADSTQVSLYYTPSVTGSEAWVVAESSVGVGSLGPVQTFTSINSISGEIIATATPVTKVSHLTSSVTELQSPVCTETATPAAAVASASTWRRFVDAKILALVALMIVVMLC